MAGLTRDGDAAVFLRAPPIEAHWLTERELAEEEYPNRVLRAQLQDPYWNRVSMKDGILLRFILMPDDYTVLIRLDLLRELRQLKGIGILNCASCTIFAGSDNGQ
jgi:hypothetical protein